MMIGLRERKQEILQQAQQDINTFLDAHKGLAFYCFALDCNAEYAEINLCLNTEEDFQETLRRYQSGPYGEHYQEEEDIASLRYNPGDWAYQCFETYYVMQEDELEKAYGEEDERKVEEMMQFSFELLAGICDTQAYARIPKTADFRVMCIDHDQDEEEALRLTDLFFRAKP